MQTGTASQAAPNPGLIFENLNAHQRSAALRTAIELEVFRAVGEGPATAAVLAERCGTSARGMRILCDFLVIMELLVKQGDTYHHTPTSAVFLDPASPASMQSTAHFLSRSDVRDAHDHLTEIVRSGHTSMPGEGTVEPDNPVWVDFAENMAPMAAGSAVAIAEMVVGRTSGPIRVLDIAAGHGLFGIEIAKRNPEARITALDWARVLDVAARNAERFGVASQIERLEGSAFDVEFGGPYDVALLTNFLHHFDVPTCVGLLKKVSAALKPGGLSATLEFVPNDDRVSPSMPAAFAMMMLVSTGKGDAYTLNELRDMHEQAGFRDVQGHPLLPGPQTVVTAVKA